MTPSCMHSPPSSWEGGTRGLTIRLIGRGVCVCGVCVVWECARACVRAAAGRRCGPPCARGWRQKGVTSGHGASTGFERAGARPLPLPLRGGCVGSVRGIPFSNVVWERAACMGMRLGWARRGSGGGSPIHRSNLHICDLENKYSIVARSISTREQTVGLRRRLLSAVASFTLQAHPLPSRPISRQSGTPTCREASPSLPLTHLPPSSYTLHTYPLARARVLRHGTTCTRLGRCWGCEPSRVALHHRLCR